MKANFILRLWRSVSNYQKALFLLFVLSLPFLDPFVAGDGVGFYAYVRSPLIDHNFSFSSDWENPKKELQELFLVDHFVENPITKTGHLPNYYPVGPAMLWSPFLIVSHLAVLASIRMGAHIPADGHSGSPDYVSPSRWREDWSPSDGPFGPPSAYGLLHRSRSSCICAHRGPTRTPFS